MHGMILKLTFDSIGYWTPAVDCEDNTIVNWEFDRIYGKLEDCSHTRQWRPTDCDPGNQIPSKLLHSLLLQPHLWLRRGGPRGGDGADGSSCLPVWSPPSSLPLVWSPTLWSPTPPTLPSVIHHHWSLTTSNQQQRRHSKCNVINIGCSAHLTNTYCCLWRARSDGVDGWKVGSHNDGMPGWRKWNPIKNRFNRGIRRSNYRLYATDFPEIAARSDFDPFKDRGLSHVHTNAPQIWGLLCWRGQIYGVTNQKITTTNCNSCAWQSANRALTMFHVVVVFVVVVVVEPVYTVE